MAAAMYMIMHVRECVRAVLARACVRFGARVRACVRVRVRVSVHVLTSCRCFG